MIGGRRDGDRGHTIALEIRAFTSMGVCACGNLVIEGFSSSCTIAGLDWQFFSPCVNFECIAKEKVVRIMRGDDGMRSDTVIFRRLWFGGQRIRVRQRCATFFPQLWSAQPLQPDARSNHRRPALYTLTDGGRK